MTNQVGAGELDGNDVIVGRSVVVAYFENLTLPFPSSWNFLFLIWFHLHWHHLHCQHSQLMQNLHSIFDRYYWRRSGVAWNLAKRGGFGGYWR